MELFPKRDRLAGSIYLFTKCKVGTAFQQKQKKSHGEYISVFTKQQGLDAALVEAGITLHCQICPVSFPRAP